MLKIYGHFLSTPSNKVRMTANALNLEYDYHSINLPEGEQKTEEYLKINPLGKVPVIDDDGFVLTESNAIIKYLCRKHDSLLYPADTKEQAVVDQMIDTCCLHIYQGIMKIAYNRLFAPMLGKESNQQEIDEGIGILDQYLPAIDERLGKSTYLAGSEVSLADITLLSAIDPVEMIKMDLSAHEKLSAWRDYMRKQDFYQKTHKFYGEAMQK